MPYLVEGEAEYLKRLRHYARVELRSVRSEKITEKRSAKEILCIEANRLMRKIPRGDMVVALNRRGKEYDSEELASKISEWQNRSTKGVVFLIGGPWGLADDVLNRSDLVLSLSKMTFTHEMVRLILLEQLYRSFTILRGEKYHK